MTLKYGQCGLCHKGELEFVEKAVVAGSNYDMVMCNNCRHKVAKRAE